MDEEHLKAAASSRNRTGNTALHQAAQGGYLLNLPQFLKSDELWAVEDAEGFSVLERHFAHLRSKA
jgi:ankyrin repeat protein